MKKDAWIRVTDLLPGPGNNVLVFNGFMGVACYYPHGWLEDHGGTEGPIEWTGVTHWQALPDPPD